MFMRSDEASNMEHGKTFETMAEDIKKQYEHAVAEVNSPNGQLAAQARLESFSKTVGAIRQQMPELLNTLRTRQEHSKQQQQQQQQQYTQQENAHYDGTRTNEKRSATSTQGLTQQQLAEKEEAIDRLLAHLDSY